MATEGARASQLTGKTKVQLRSQLKGQKSAAAPAPSPPAPLERPPITLNDSERSKLCLETDVSMSTIYRWEEGRHVSRTNKRRLERAVKKLGIELRPRSTDGTHGTRRRVVDVQQRVA